MYYLTERFDRKHFRAAPCEPHRSFEFDKLIRSEVDPPEGLAFRWSSGADRPGPIVWTTVLAILISEEVARLLRVFSGWQPLAVSLAGQKGQKFAGYSMIAVAGRCGRFLWQNAVQLPPAESGERFAVRRGLCFEMDSRNSADVMVPRIPANFLFVSQSVRDALSTSISSNNCLLTPCDEVTFPEMLYEDILEKERTYWT